MRYANELNIVVESFSVLKDIISIQKGLVAIAFTTNAEKTKCIVLVHCIVYIDEMIKKMYWISINSNNYRFL